MRHAATIAAAFIAAGCSTTAMEPSPEVLAIQDYVEVAELTEVKRFRSDNSSRYGRLDNPRYMLIHARRQTYLIEFARNCYELMNNRQVTRDVRSDGDTLTAGRDTIRGCLIGRAFEVNDAQVQEIRNLGEAPTGG